MGNFISPADLKKLIANDGALQSQIIQTMDVKLNTNPAIRFVADNYQAVRESFKMIFVRSHKKLATNTEGLNEFSQLIANYRKELNSNLNNLNTMIISQTEKFEAELAEDFGVHVSEIQYTNPANIRAEPKCPEERRFWELCMNFDQMMVMLDQLWHLGEAEIEHKNNTTTNLVGKLNGMVKSADKKARKIRFMLNEYERSGTLKPQNKAEQKEVLKPTESESKMSEV